MESKITEIEEEVRALSAEDRSELLRRLIAELDGAPDLDVEQAWIAAAQRRHQDILAGNVQTVPGEEVFKHLRSRLKR